LQVTDLLVKTGLPALVATHLAAGELAFVTNQNSSDLSILDVTQMTEIDRISIPGKPAGVALDPAGKVVFTVSPDSKTLRKLTQSGEILAQVQLDGGPIGIALSPDGGSAFVSDWYNAQIWVIDTTQMKVTRTLSTGANPAGLAVSVFDLAGDSAVRNIKVGARPFGLAITDDNRAFVGNVGSNSVSVVDLASGTSIATVDVGQKPYGVAFANGKGFVSNQYSDTVSVIDLTSLTVLSTIDVGEYPEGIDATPDERMVVVANWFSNTVSLIDAQSLEVTGEIETGDGPRAFGRFIGVTGREKS